MKLAEQNLFSFLPLYTILYKEKFELNWGGGGGGIQPSDKFRLTFQKYSVLVQESEPVLQNV